MKINRHVGIEIEVSESTNNSRLPIGPFWTKKSDGSVSTWGREYTFTNKLIGENVISAVNCLTAHLEQEGVDAVVGENQHTGYHLHIDFTDHSLSEALHFCDIGYSIQDWMFATVASWRNGYGYCAAWNGFPSEYFNKNKSFNKWSDELNISMCPRYWIHYKNMHSGSRKRTVEIRMHESTKDADSILTWAEFWSQLANACCTTDISACLTCRDRYDLLDRLDLSPKTRERFLNSLEKL